VVELNPCDLCVPKHFSFFIFHFSFFILILWYNGDDMKFPKSVVEEVRRQECLRHTPAKLRVLGVDASLRSTGLGIVEAEGGILKYVDARCVKNKPALLLSECLVNLKVATEAYIEEFKPDEAAFEGIFFCKNARTALIMGHARGVILSCCAAAGIPAYEYPPTRVKQATTGGGGAVKGQMQAMMMSMLDLPELPREDAADALAIAITRIHETSGFSANPAKEI